MTEATKPHSSLRRAFQTAAEYLEAGGQGRRDELAELFRDAMRIEEQFEALEREVERLQAEAEAWKRHGQEETFRRERLEEQFEDEDVVERCGDPCPQAPDLDPCQLPKGHAYPWHRSRSSAWPVKNEVQGSVR